MNLSHHFYFDFFLFFVLVFVQLASTFTRFHIFSLGARWCYCCLFALSFYHRHLAIFMHFIFSVIFFSLCSLILIGNCIILYFPTNSCPLHLHICCDYLDQLFFGDTNIVITFDSCVCVWVRFFLYLLISVQHLLLCACHFYLFIFIWIICPVWIWIRLCIGICPNEMRFFAELARFCFSSIPFKYTQWYTFPHQFAVFVNLSDIRMCFANAYRILGRKAHSKNRNKSSTSIPI